MQEDCARKQAHYTNRHSTGLQQGPQGASNLKITSSTTTATVSVFGFGAIQAYVYSNILACSCHALSAACLAIAAGLNVLPRHGAYLLDQQPSSL